MALTILDQVPDSLKGAAIDAVPFECEACQCRFMWAKRKGQVVRCPRCKASEDVPALAKAVPAENPEPVV